MNTTDHIAAIREHLTVLTNNDNDAARLVGEVLADFPSIIAAVSGPLGEHIEDLENLLSNAAKHRVMIEQRISRAASLLDMCIGLSTEEEDDED